GPPIAGGHARIPRTVAAVGAYGHRLYRPLPRAGRAWPLAGWHGRRWRTGRAPGRPRRLPGALAPTPAPTSRSPLCGRRGATVPGRAVGGHAGPAGKSRILSELP